MPGGFHPTKEAFLAWPKPNYVDPETKGNQLLIVTIISTILLLASVIARIPTVGIAGLLILTETKFRWFRHIWDVPLDEITGRQYVSEELASYPFSRNVDEVAGIAQFSCPDPCRPISSYWLQFSYPDPYTEKFSCLYEGSVPISNACISVVTDFFAAMLPMFLFLQLQMPKRDKYGLGAIFGVGFIVCICGIIRSVLVYHIFYQSFDVTWLSHDLWAWTYVETNLLVICSAIPPLRVLFKRLVGNKLSHNTSKMLEHNLSHARRPSNHVNPTETAKSGDSTEAIALHGMEPGTSRSLENQAKVTRQVVMGHKSQNSQRFSKVYLDKELPAIQR
ncbi:hypothetical protein V492_03982 [Pseudogymnoascus sp. VKM F-4246]|nr:hypothetical protein V492_03982 [Pseudogymnoascus sp. VKM F-4246]